MKKYLPLVYKVITILLAVIFIRQGVEQILLTEHIIEEYAPSGLPNYMFQLMGVGKILAAIAIISGVFIAFKKNIKWVVEWAYAGLFFILTGALVAHIVIGWEMGHLVSIPIIMALLLFSAHYWRNKK